MSLDPTLASPLAWPDGWNRTTHPGRIRGRFNSKSRHYAKAGFSYTNQKELTVAAASDRLATTMDRMGCPRGKWLLSTDLALRNNGFPRSGQRMPDDPGAVCYWIEPGGDQRCMAIDRYDRIADNIAAIAATLEAMRSIERYGGAEILDRAYSGFTALPDPNKEKPWWQTLGVDRDCTFQEAKTAYRSMASNAHPDRGGSAAQMAEINTAWERAQQFIQEQR